MIAGILLLGGAVLILLAAIGVLRFGDVLARMHALSKASTLGFVLVIAGAALSLARANDITYVVLAGVLQVLTSPVGANLIGRATYLASGIPHRLDEIDELALSRTPPEPEPPGPESPR